jgi:hypothetical protein
MKQGKTNEIVSSIRPPNKKSYHPSSHQTREKKRNRQATEQGKTEEIVKPLNKGKEKKSSSHRTREKKRNRQATEQGKRKEIVKPLNKGKQKKSYHPSSHRDKSLKLFRPKGLNSDVSLSFILTDSERLERVIKFRYAVSLLLVGTATFNRLLGGFHVMLGHDTRELRDFADELDMFEHLRPWVKN